MEVVHLSSEFAPLSRPGSFGDAVLGLCREMTWKGHRTTVFLPYFDSFNTEDIDDLTLIDEDLFVPYGPDVVRTQVWQSFYQGVSLYLFRPLKNSFLLTQNPFGTKEGRPFFSLSERHWSFYKRKDFAPISFIFTTGKPP